MNKQIKINLDDIDFTSLNNDGICNELVRLMNLYFENGHDYLASFIANKLLMHFSIVKIIQNCFEKEKSLIDPIFNDNLAENKENDESFTKVSNILLIISRMPQYILFIKRFKTFSISTCIMILIILYILKIINIPLAFLLFILSLILFLVLIPYVFSILFKPYDVNKYKEEVDQKLINVFNDDENKIHIINKKYMELYKASNDIEISNAILHFQKS